MNNQHKTRVICYYVFLFTISWNIKVHCVKFDVHVTVHLVKFDVHVTVHRVKFDVHVTVHRVKFLIIKPTRCTNFSNLFLEWNSTCFGQFLCPSSGVFTVHTAMIYVIQVCWQLVSRSIRKIFMCIHSCNTFLKICELPDN